MLNAVQLMELQNKIGMAKAAPTDGVLSLDEEDCLVASLTEALAEASRLKAALDEREESDDDNL